MKKNMGKLDQILRVVFALVVSVLYGTGKIEGALGITLLILGAVFIFTSFLNFCPLYLPFGINTCEKKENK